MPSTTYINTFLRQNNFIVTLELHLSLKCIKKTYQYYINLEVLIKSREAASHSLFSMKLTKKQEKQSQNKAIFPCLLKQTKTKRGCQVLPN